MDDLADTHSLCHSYKLNVVEESTSLFHFMIKHIISDRVFSLNLFTNVDKLVKCHSNHFVVVKGFACRFECGRNISSRSK